MIYPFPEAALEYDEGLGDSDLKDVLKSHMSHAKQRLNKKYVSRI